MDKPLLRVPLDIGRDEHVAQRPVLAADPRRIVAQRLARGEPAQDVLDHRRVGVELRDVASDVLFRRIAEQFKLRAVGPQDRPVRPDPVQRHRAVLEKVVELLAEIHAADCANLAPARLTCLCSENSYTRR
jgi:hypothetical protein